MKRTRKILGLVLIIAAVSGMIFWETIGREKVMLESVIVAAEVIPAGTLIERRHLEKTGVLSGNRIYKSYKWETLPQVLGKVALQDIVKNSQISKEYLGENDFIVKYPKSIFVLHSNWIDMCSSSIRRGDWVDIYIGSDLRRIGTYQVAFVKDSNNVEITDGEGRKESEPLNRVYANSPVDCIEIITDMSEYRKIKDEVNNSEDGLLLIQNGGIR